MHERRHSVPQRNVGVRHSRRMPTSGTPPALYGTALATELVTEVATVRMDGMSTRQLLRRQHRPWVFMIACPSPMAKCPDIHRV